MTPIKHRARFELLEDRLLLAFDPTGLEQELLEHVNRMRMDPQGELNVLFTSIDPLVSPDASVNTAIDYWNDPTSAEIQSEWPSLAPTHPVAWHEALHDAALAHTELMLQHDEQSHRFPEEPNLGDRITAAGYENWSHAAENIFGYAESVFHGHSGFAVDWGVPDRAHRATIMDSANQEIGISILPQNDPGKELGPLVVTQDFGSRRDFDDPYLLGAVFEDLNEDTRYNAGEGLGDVNIEVVGPPGTFTTTTMSAGGYQLTVPSGTYTVTASGGGLSRPVVETDVVIGSVSAKLDFQPSEVLDDFGDAPAQLGYPTLFEAGGAYHEAVAGYYLGAGVDEEADGQPNATATGDDVADSDDEDGVTFDSAFVLGATASITVDASATGKLDAWIDFNADGDWSDSGERVFSGESLVVGDNDLGVFVPVDAALGTTFARFRFSSAGVASFTGGAADGEVEDYALEIQYPTEIQNGTLTVPGTGGDDTLEFTPDDNVYTVVLNGQVRQYPAADVDTVLFDGGLGNDTATVTGTAGDETAELWPGTGGFAGAGLTVDVTDTETITIHGGGGTDVATFFNSPGKDEFSGWGGSAGLTGPGVVNSAYDFLRIYAYGNPGEGDVAKLYDAATDDYYVVTPSYGGLYADGCEVHTRYFREVYGYANQDGFDTAKFYDSPHDDVFTSTADACEMSNTSYLRRAELFESVQAYATAGGNDVAHMHDGPGTDWFVATGVDGIMVRPQYLHRTKWFEEVYAWGEGDGYNYARLYDTANDDSFNATPQLATLSGQRVEGGTYFNQVQNFGAVHAYAWAGGHDVADLYGSPGADVYYGSPVEGSMTDNATYWNRAKYFEQINAHAVGQGDTALLFDSALADLLEAEGNWARLSNDTLGFARYVADFAHLKVTGSSNPGDTKRESAVDYWLEIEGVWQDE